jgi:hypothetical protein
MNSKHKKQILAWIILAISFVFAYWGTGVFMDGFERDVLHQHIHMK